MEQQTKTVKIYSSFAEEAEAEYQRRSEQSPQDRIHEFAILQERCWGEKWTHQAMSRVVSFEKVPW
ncbi:hypothetical protein [Spirochaeta dissipatitropha]